MAVSESLCVRHPPTHSFVHSFIRSFTHPLQAVCEVPELCQAGPQPLRRQEGLQEAVMLGLNSAGLAKSLCLFLRPEFFPPEFPPPL